jgi:hypothetical protein
MNKNYEYTVGEERIDVICSIWQFGEKHDLSALFRFMLYARENGFTEDEMMATIMHDLNGRYDKCFSPRSSSY